MITGDKMNIVAQRFAPDPNYVDYWIDLSMDSTGNIIKSFSDNKWMPLNAKADKDLWRHILELVDALGFLRDEDDKIILPDNDNVYFTGDTITDLLASGDELLNKVTETLEELGSDLEDFKVLKGKKNGLAELDENGTVPRDQLPSYVDDVIDVYATFCVSEIGVLSKIHLYKDPEHTDEITQGEPDKIYVNVNGGNTPWPDEDTVADDKYKNIPYQFRWSGSQFVHIDCNVLILGEITGTAFDGGKGKKLEDTVGSIDKLVLEITETPELGDSDVKIKFSQGEKGKGGTFTYTAKNVTLTAATKDKAGIMSKEDKATVDTASSLPTDLVSTISKNDQTDHHDVTLSLKTYKKSDDTGKYIESTLTIDITNATNDHAGTMSAEDHTKLWTTLPGELALAKTLLEAKDTEIENKHTEFEEKAKKYKEDTEATLTEIKENLKSIADTTGLKSPTEEDGGDYGLPDSERDDHFIQNAKTVFSAVEALDKVIYEDCVRWTKKGEEPERKIIVLPEHSSLEGVKDGGEEPTTTLNIAKINSLNTSDEAQPATTQLVEIGNTELHLDLQSKDRPTVELLPDKAEEKPQPANIINHVAYTLDELWYGVKFDMGDNEGSPDGIRTGNLTFHKTLPIQNKMKGCTIDDANDTIKYLNPEDWKQYADGTEPVQDPENSHLNFFVEIPEHYRLFLQTPDNNIEIRISEYNLPGYTHVERKYIGAYEGTMKFEYANAEPVEAAAEATVEALWSRPNWLTPTVNKTRQVFQLAARKSPDKSDNNIRSTNWNMYTYGAHVDMTWLFVVEYATLNSLKDFNIELTPEGYHQGGLGPGVTKGLPSSSTYSWIPCGVTHILGSKTGIVCYDNGDGGTLTLPSTCTGCDKTENGHFSTSTVSGFTKCTKTEVPRYRGIENPFGHVWKNTVDVIFAGTNTDHNVYVCKDYTKFKGDSITASSGTISSADGYELQPFKDCGNAGYLRELVGTNFGDLFCKECNSSGDKKYYCDYHYTISYNSGSTAYTLFIGSRSGDGYGAGLFYLYSADSVTASTAAVGTRLTFYGEPTDKAADAAKTLAYAMQPQYFEGPYAEGLIMPESTGDTAGFGGEGVQHDSYTMNDDNSY